MLTDLYLAVPDVCLDEGNSGWDSGFLRGVGGQHQSIAKATWQP